MNMNKRKEQNNTNVQINASEQKVMFVSKDKFAHSIYPIIAGVPTAIVILYFLDLGTAYQDLLRNLISPIVTGVTSGFILHFIGLKK